MEFVLNLIRFPFSGSGQESQVSLWESAADHFVPHARNNYHPHLFHHRLLGLFSVLLVSAKIFTLALLTFGPALPAYSSAITVPNIISLTNASRETMRLSDLTENQLLDQAAQTKANDMLAKGYFSHNTPDGKTPWDFIQATGYNYISAGENLAVNFVEAENVEQAWMNSPGHRANILNKDFEEIGIGISQGTYQNHTAIFVVQMFGAPMVQKLVTLPEPTKVQITTVPAPQPVVAQAAAPVSSGQPVAAAPVLPEMKIVNVDSGLAAADVWVKAQVANAVKVLAFYGNGQAVQLQPRSGDHWEASMPLADVQSSSNPVKIVAYNLLADTQTQNVASFAGSTVASFGFLGKVAGAHTNFLGYSFDPKQAEDKFYLLFIAGMLTALVVAISVKRHVQHLALIANGSFVVMMAALLYMAR